MTHFHLSLGGEAKLQTQILRSLDGGSTSVLCGASAYISTYGARFLLQAEEQKNLTPGFFVAGTSGYISHPNAIKMLLGGGWNVRLGNEPDGIFHPKFLVGGQNFSTRTGIKNASFGYIGSANMTRGGLLANCEIGAVFNESSQATSLAEIFSTVWKSAEICTPARLSRYERDFSARMQKRSTSDLIDLGILTKKELLDPTPKATDPAAIDPGVGSTVWVGLQSYTGEHRFQVEIPGQAGAVLNGLLGMENGTVDAVFTDGHQRSIRYAYYSANGMYRLNIPNDAPLVDWARENHSGILVVSHTPDAGLSMEIKRGEAEMEERRRSYALGTWGSTSTRRYGWY